MYGNPVEFRSLTRSIRLTKDFVSPSKEMMHSKKNPSVAFILAFCSPILGIGARPHSHKTVEDTHLRGPLADPRGAPHSISTGEHCQAGGHPKRRARDVPSTSGFRRGTRGGHPTHACIAHCHPSWTAKRTASPSRSRTFHRNRTDRFRSMRSYKHPPAFRSLEGWSIGAQ